MKACGGLYAYSGQRAVAYLAIPGQLNLRFFATC
jgi:hypothetical protein